MQQYLQFIIQLRLRVNRLLCVHSGLAVVLVGKRALVTLLGLSSSCLVTYSRCHWFDCWRNQYQGSSICNLLSN